MTVAAWPVDTCPACLESMSVELDADLRMCLKCRHEWKPSETFGPVDGAAVPASLAPAPALSAVPEADGTDGMFDYIAAARSRYLGARVLVHELEVEGTVDEITDDGETIVGFGSGYFVTVTPDGFSAIELSTVSDEFVSAFGALNLAMAAQILRAGANTLTGPDDDRRITVPPEGFLPDDPDALMSIEHGVAYAVAIVMRSFGVPSDQIRELANELDKAATAAERG